MAAVVKHTLSEVLEFIKNSNLRIGQIYAGHLAKIADEDFPVQSFNFLAQRKDGESVNLAVDFVRNYLTKFPARYTLLMKPSANATEGIIKVYFEPSINDSAVAAPVMNNVPAGVNGELLNYAVQLEQLRAEIRFREMEREKQDLQREIERQSGINGRFAAVAELLIEKFAGAFGLVPDAAPVAMQGVNAEDFETAVEFLVQTFGADGVVKLAALLQQKPEFVSIVKSQIN